MVKKKNIHILPTDKPSRLILQGSELLLSKYMEVNEGFSEFNQHLFITSDEEIKKGDWYLDPIIDTLFKSDKIFLNWDGYKKIILTTDGDLIKDGVQKIDDEFLEWFVKNPSCESVYVEKTNGCQNNKGFKNCCDFDAESGECWCDNNHKIIIPKEEPKQYTSEEMEGFENFKKVIKPKQIKCYCGHTITCDCGPLEELKQETVFEKAKLILRKHILKNKEQVIKDLDEMREQSNEQETLEEAAEREYETRKFNSDFPFDSQSFKLGANWQQEQILQFLYSEITERRPYSSSKMCEVVIEFIEQFKKK